MKKYYFFAMTILFTSSVSAQSLDKLNELDHLNKAMDALNQMKASVETRARETKYACLKALGREGFCGCLSEKLPIMWSFYEYVLIVTQSKEQNGYSQLTKDQKRAYDAVSSVREACVSVDSKAP